MVWNLFPSKVILVLQKARILRLSNLACGGAKSPGWFDVLPKNSARDVMHERAHYCDEAAIRQLPTAVAFWMFKLNAKFDADWLLYLLSHFECDGHTVHMLTQQHLPPSQTSIVKSSLFTHAHSSPLFVATSLHGCWAQTVLVILTMAEQTM